MCVLPSCPCRCTPSPTPSCKYCKLRQTRFQMSADAAMCTSNDWPHLHMLGFASDLDCQSNAGASACMSRMCRSTRLRLGTSLGRVHRLGARHPSGALLPYERTWLSKGCPGETSGVR